jgi:hypothetical protein
MSHIGEEKCHVLRGKRIQSITKFNNFIVSNNRTKNKVLIPLRNNHHKI